MTTCPLFGEPYCRCLYKPMIEDEPTIKETLHKLFSDHAVYTKFVINNILDSQPGTDDLIARLMENQEDIGQFIGSKRLTEVLKEHIRLAGEAVKAVKSGDKQAIDKAGQDLLKQGNKVAIEISAINPQLLPYNKIREEFTRHNKFVIDLTVLHNQRNTNLEIKTYDAYFNHMISLSDMIADAIARTMF